MITPRDIPKFQDLQNSPIELETPESVFVAPVFRVTRGNEHDDLRTLSIETTIDLKNEMAKIGWLSFRGQRYASDIRVLGEYRGSSRVVIETLIGDQAFWA